MGIAFLLCMTSFDASAALLHYTKRRERCRCVNMLRSWCRGCISSGFRVYYDILLLDSTGDSTWLEAKNDITGATEIASVLIIACFPVMPRLYQHLRGKPARTAWSPPSRCHRRKLLPAPCKSTISEKAKESFETTREGGGNVVPPERTASLSTLKGTMSSLSKHAIDDG